MPGVLKAGVVASDTFGKGRLRVRLAPGEDHEHVAWAVAATLRERFGLALDPAAFRLRTADDGPPGPTTRRWRRRDTT